MNDSLLATHCFIIAEAGVNHNGSVETAKKLIEVAAVAGADAVKFQTFKAEKLVSKYAPKAEYQKEATGENESQLEMIGKLELDLNAHKELLNHSIKNKITFLSTPFDLESIELLKNLGLDIFKIPSGEITNLPYLRRIGGIKKRVILSTGMAELGEIENALKILVASGTPKKNITVLHCNTEYPTLYKDVNLLAMHTIRKKFNINVGYSDHTNGIEVPIAAVALGAYVIEKHFTLDRNMGGPDHRSSIEPDELNQMVASIRNIEKALGNGIKKPSASELKNMEIARKSITASRDIKAGEGFCEENITAKRPGTGISPMEWDNVIGREAGRNFRKDELISV